MKILWLVSLAIIAISSCNNSPTNQVSDVIPAADSLMPNETPAPFFKKFRGEFNGKPITLYLIRFVNKQKPDSVIYGFMEMSDGDIPLEISGQLLGSDSIILKGIINQEEQIVLSGKFINPTLIKAIYANEENPIEFIDITEGLEVSPVNYYREHLEIQTSQDGIGGMCDSFLAYINLNNLIFGTGQYNVEKLNDILDNKLNFKERLNDSSLPETFDEDVITRIMYLENGFITLQVEETSYPCGAAHGTYGYTYYNFDLNSGDTISLSDLIITDSLEVLKLIGLQIFKKAYDKQDEELTDFYLPSNFAVLKKGLLFRYRPYEMGSFAEGAMEVFIPYSEIQGIMIPNNILADQIY